MNDKDFQILKAYLCESKSHRWIQENIMKLPTPLNGGGYKAMEVLHSYSIKGDKKGLLSEFNVTSENIFGLLNELSSDALSNSPIYIEGALTSKFVNAYERNPKARMKCLEHYGTQCAACNFDFEKTYGEAGKGYIEVHHVLPLTSLKKEYVVNPVQDLIPLCANCHAIVHRKNPIFTLTEIKDMLENNQ